MLKGSLERHAAQVEGVRTALADVSKALQEGGVGRMAAARPEPRRGPDPSRRYEISLDGAPARGGEKAKVTIVEFLDFQCPFCARVQPTLEQVRKAYGDDVRVAFKHLPLPMHTQAASAAAASEAAHRQGKFWEMHDKIFANARSLSEESYVRWAGELGLDVEKFKQDLASADVKQRVERDAQEAQRLGVSGTPSFFVNGRFVSGAQPFESFKRMVDEELGKAAPKS
jgi:protein-disulfide isomerase